MIMRTYIIVLAAVLSGTFAARAGNPRTPAGIIFEKSCRCVTDVIWDTTFVVVPGAEYTGLALETAGGERQQVYLMEIKPDSCTAMLSSTLSNKRSMAPINESSSEGM